MELAIVKFHHRSWRGWHESVENPPVFDFPLVCLPHYVERHLHRNPWIFYQDEEIKSKNENVTGSSFDKEIVGLLVLVSRREEF